jgi:secreted trypsin-like serine protease
MPSEILLNIDVGYLSDEECGSMRGGEKPDSMVCAKRSNGQGTCNADSGGPLIIKGGNGASDLQVGVVSFGSGRGCADIVIPDVFARVSNAYEWIQSEVCKGSTYASEAGFDCSRLRLHP